MSARAVQDFYVFTDNQRIKTYNGIPQKPDYHKPVKPSRALRRLLTAFRYEVKGVFHVDGIFADGKDRKKKTSAKQDYQDSDLGCSSQSAVPYRLAIVLNSGRETICSRMIFFVKHPILLYLKKFSRLCTVLWKNWCCRTHYFIFHFPHTGYIHFWCLDFSDTYPMPTQHRIFGNNNGFMNLTHSTMWYGIIRIISGNHICYTHMKVIPNAMNIASAKKITPSDAVFCFGAYHKADIAKTVKTNVVIIFKIINPSIFSSSFLQFHRSLPLPVL